MRKAIFMLLAAGLCAPALAQSTSSNERAEITITNDRNEAVVMTFDYAFRQYTWNLIKHEISAQDEIVYRYPSNIPGCEYLREWQITDGLLRIANANGLLCEKRVSLCDMRVSTMSIGVAACRWSDR